LNHEIALVDPFNFYDGEPIEIGVPVVLELIQKSSGTIVKHGDAGNRQGSDTSQDGSANKR
jgi:hypothetical protein